ncbi:hypothetical protein [Actinoplanes sp. RD1]|uniref:hypothetical protein n=1 Tax=Actinoplanes sp. RD1 TaxID=3064538 RepID=UPI002741EDF9|nr:hypothetical protein [Actinoplanes sp. RD1]
MTGIDEVVRTIEIRAAQASDGAGLTERVLAGAARVRRRRQWAAVAAAATVVLGAAAAFPVTARLRADHAPPTTPQPVTVSTPPSREPVPTPSAPTPSVATSFVPTPAPGHYRDLGQLTVAPAGGSAYTWRRGTSGALQWMVPFTTSSKGDTCCAAMVRVYDPGMYDARDLRRGEQVRVAGHAAWFGTTTVTAPTEPPEIRSDSVGDFEVPTLGWQDKSGAWVTVINGQDAPEQFRTKGGALRAEMFAIAADVRLTAPEDPLVPMHFRKIPGDLPMSFSYADDREFQDGQQATLGFGGDTGVPQLYLGGSSTTGARAPLEISAWTATTTPWTELRDQATPAGKVAGHPAWVAEGPDGESILLVEAGTCGIEVKAPDPDDIALADRKAMFSGATFDRCDSTATWTRPLN